MRSSYYLLDAAMILLFSCAAPAQDFNLQLTPPYPPIEIPEHGGSFSYQVAITNNDTTPQQCTLWCIVTAPDGDQRLALQPWTVGFTAGQTIQRSLTQSVPAFSPTGYYLFTVNIGIYPNIFWDSDQFTFYKVLPPEWVARYNGREGNDEANSLTVDGSSNVYVTGFSMGSGTSCDYATIKYDSNGNQIWVARYNGLGNDDDRANSIAVDSGGNVYVTGYSYGSGTYEDYATIKYDASGNQLWAARYNGLGDGIDWANSLLTDNLGNVYVTGYSYGSGTGDDYATIKYSGGNLAGWEPVTATVLGAPLPSKSRLEPNYPNPFNATTVASYKLQVASHVSLRIYDTAGRLVSSLIDGWREAGSHEVTFDGSGLPSGVYLARLKAGDFSQVQKLVLLK